MCLWVIGDFVLDVAIELDLEDLYANDPSLHERIRLERDRLHIHPDLQFIVDVYGHSLAFDLHSNAKIEQQHFLLEPGHKYDLRELPRSISGASIRETHHDSPSANGEAAMFVRAMPRKISWGGGGLNLVMTVRDISPPDKTALVKFSAISNQWRLKSIRGVLQQLLSVEVTPGRVLRDALEGTEPIIAPEELVQYLADQIRSFGPDLNVIEWALAARRIAFAFHRDGVVQPVESAGGDELLLPKLNLVISRVSSDRIDLKDKIILKSPDPVLQDALRGPQLSQESRESYEGRRTEWRQKTKAFVTNAFEDESFLMLNSVRDATLVECLLNAYQGKRERHASMGGVVAMTDANQNHIDLLFKRTGIDERRVTNLSLIFNETEIASSILRLYEYAKLESNEEPLAAALRDAIDRLGAGTARSTGYKCATEYLDKARDPARRDLIAGLGPLSGRRVRLDVAVELLDIFRQAAKVRERLYLTLGSHGSLCLDRSDRAWYAGTYQGPDQVYDTTGLGDAWAATITLLQYHAVRASKPALRHAYRQSWAELGAKEFLMIAAAVAYCKFANPTGRVFLPKLLQVLRTQYLPVTEVHALNTNRLSATVLGNVERERIEDRRRPKVAERAMCDALFDIFPS